MRSPPRKRPRAGLEGRRRDHRDHPERESGQHGFRGRRSPDGERTPRPSQALLAHRFGSERHQLLVRASSLSRSCASATQRSGRPDRAPRDLALASERPDLIRSSRFQVPGRYSRFWQRRQASQGQFSGQNEMNRDRRRNHPPDAKLLAAKCQSFPLVLSAPKTHGRPRNRALA